LLIVLVVVSTFIKLLFELIEMCGMIIGSNRDHFV